MEGSSRLKIKIGDHEFEAEGPAETVQAQFRVFKELIAKERKGLEPGEPLQPPPVPKNNSQLRLDSIMKTEAHTVDHHSG